MPELSHSLFGKKFSALLHCKKIAIYLFVVLGPTRNELGRGGGQCDQIGRFLKGLGVTTFLKKVAQIFCDILA